MNRLVKNDAALEMLATKKYTVLSEQEASKNERKYRIIYSCLGIQNKIYFTRWEPI